MKNNKCLSEQDLVLHYYDELSASGAPAHHLVDCPLCAERFAALGDDLAKLPKLSQEPNPAANIRMVARVNEQLSSNRRSWIPALGASAAAVIALVITLSIWSPQEELLQTAQTSTPPSMTTMSLSEDMPDIDFIEDLDLLKELDLLSQIEGV